MEVCTVNNDVVLGAKCSPRKATETPKVKLGNCFCLTVVPFFLEHRTREEGGITPSLQPSLLVGLSTAVMLFKCWFLDLIECAFIERSNALIRM